MRKEEELLVALRRVIRAVDLRSKQLSKHVGLTGPQLLVMQNIQERPGIMVREIADSINLSPATITNILDRLEARDLATRIRSTQDKRKVGVFLTERGKAAVVDAPRPLQEHFVERFSQLKEWEQSQMVATVQRIASMMDAEDIDASPFLELGSITEKNM
ncbi:MAG TPA: MarR family transcriptional regulator [Alteromonas australica]|jgi:DNA-binding MarR family transcriptional regulator|uniref:Transcriptional regulator n=1 Tax=Alteromonas australica TaxID=589873 RepID=A0A075NZ08_9ALTE|nr:MULTISPECIES: MarR family transcriptional regulator [Alteromonas]MAF71165.1 MarR family transcriptional regulator [Alteromonas sp.]AIF98791.1 transcriptional regulator [Alteromonas australica]AJP43797.1 transcriptional regulator [Alteromonas australica]MAO29672.1 MarR family transcriptional regulator [Alteromonas sp.]MBU33647.1 MarR family transcriptional regulator [Alteromonas sp.]|tara:strand:- start:1837 stop:2316 length:480 start_codon:yes stop_codon:yes gene_type:complete